jgi:hypothetical protein
MYSKYHISTILLFLICLISISCNPREIGYVLTNNNDTITSVFAMYRGVPYVYENSDNSGPVSPTTFIVKNKNKKDTIKVCDIKSINFVDKRNKSISIYIFNTFFWKLLTTKNTFGIYVRYYDNSTGYMSYLGNVVVQGYADENDIEIAIFFGKEQKAVIYSGTEIKTLSGQAKRILNAINTRYNLNLTQDEFFKKYIDKTKDFEHQTKLFEFILDKEAELEKIQSGK